MQNPINTSPVSQFIQSVRAAELAQHKEVKLTIQQARMLNMTLTEMLDKLNRDLESVYRVLKNSSESEVVSVQMDGGGFEEPK
jgi:hypothetical protein